MQQPVALFDRNLRARGSGVLGGVGERLGHDVVGGHLDRVRGRVGVRMSSFTGIAARRARVRRAGPSPPSDRIAGTM
ncbi:MAG TPA: hypothetical protein VGO16_00280 [Pseudonocardiaceae bacterium]|nr:hypothetical protein [Pseudonocardiaceae bacterium]